MTFVKGLRTVADSDHVTHFIIDVFSPLFRATGECAATLTYLEELFSHWDEPVFIRSAGRLFYILFPVESLR